MKKHIIGLALFSFIVSAAAIIYAVFNISCISIGTTRQDILIAEKQSETDMPIVTQAVYSIETKKLSWELNKSVLKRGTVLHWVLIDEKGIEKLHSFYATEYLNGSQGEFNVGSTSVLSEMMSKISPNANLYLVIDTKSENGVSDEMKRMEAFDINKAVPVTINYGK